VIQEILAERQGENILKVLEARFGESGRALETQVSAAHAEGLDDLLKLAATCRSLTAFRKKVSP
jgi:hypothetical protein